MTGHLRPGDRFAITAATIATGLRLVDGIGAGRISAATADRLDLPWPCELTPKGRRFLAWLEQREARRR